MEVLEGKYIPILDSIMYSIDIMPKKIDPNGRIRTPEEIKKGTFEFVHSVYIDRIGNVYIVPSKCVDGQWIDCYTPQDIVKAVLMDIKSKALIESVRAELKELYKKDLLSDTFLQRLYDQEKDSILPSMNKHRAEYGEELLNFAMPASPKTIFNMTYLEAVQVMHTALPIVE